MHQGNTLPAPLIMAQGGDFYTAYLFNQRGWLDSLRSMQVITTDKKNRGEKLLFQNRVEF
jgi:hypothetical protein